MIKTFGVAALAAASAFLHPASAAASERNPVTDVSSAAVRPAFEKADIAFTPVVPVTAVPSVLPIARAPIAGVNAATAVTPGRFRPDRPILSGMTAPALPTPAVLGGINAQAGTRPLADLVAQHMGTASADEQFDCLARTVYFESRGEPLEGQLAVAEVVLNRVRSGRFRESICGVVTQPAQFSFVRAGIIPEVPRGSTAWQRSVAIAHIAMDRLAQVNGQDSLFFHATYVHTNWGRPRIAQIGNHIFYR
jgi:N-acetylmuramoyl-L-alanine amidase